MYLRSSVGRLQTVKLLTWHRLGALLHVTTCVVQEHCLQSLYAMIKQKHQVVVAQVSRQPMLWMDLLEHHLR